MAQDALDARLVIQESIHLMALMSTFNVRILALSSGSDTGSGEFKRDVSENIKETLGFLQHWKDEHNKNDPKEALDQVLLEEVNMLIACFEILQARLHTTTLTPIVLSSFFRQVLDHMGG